MIDKEKYRRVIEAYKYPPTITFEGVERDDLEALMALMKVYGYIYDNEVSYDNNAAFIMFKTFREISRVNYR